MFNVVLVEPEIPPNTGNIGRLCLATRSTLHLSSRSDFRSTTGNCAEQGSIIGTRYRCNCGIRSMRYSGRNPRALVIFF